MGMHSRPQLCTWAQGIWTQVLMLVQQIVLTHWAINLISISKMESCIHKLCCPLAKFFYTQSIRAPLWPQNLWVFTTLTLTEGRGRGMASNFPLTRYASLDKTFSIFCLTEYVKIWKQNLFCKKHFSDFSLIHRACGALDEMQILRNILGCGVWCLDFHQTAWWYGWCRSAEDMWASGKKYFKSTFAL